MSQGQQTDASTHISGEVRQLIGFTIGGNLFGADIASVHEIVRSADLTEMPNAPDYVEGLMKLHRRIFPLINLRKKLGLKPSGTTANSRVIVIEINGMLTGIRVDAVTGVLEINPQDIMDAEADRDRSIDPIFCSGVCPVDAGEIILPDFDRIFLMNE